MKILVKETGKKYDCTLNQYHAADDSMDPDCLFRYGTDMITEDMFDYSHDVFAYAVQQDLFTRFCDFWAAEVLGANTDRNFQGAYLSALSDTDFSEGNIWKFTIEEI